MYPGWTIHNVTTKRGVSTSLSTFCVLISAAFTVSDLTSSLWNITSPSLSLTFFFSLRPRWLRPLTAIHLLFYFLNLHFQTKVGCCVHLRNDITFMPMILNLQYFPLHMGIRLNCHFLNEFICVVYPSPNSTVKLFDYITSIVEHILTHFLFAEIRTGWLSGGVLNSWRRQS